MPTLLTDTARPAGPFPSVEDIETKGGYRSVADATARDAIPAYLRSAGMLVRLLDTGAFYTLGGDLSTWTLYAPGGGGGYDDWANVRSMLNILTAQLSASRMGFADGWIDSLLDTSGLTLASCAGQFSAGQAASIAGGAYLIPTMTSNTAPSGVCSGSSTYGGTYDYWKAFNRTAIAGGTDCWYTEAGLPQWLKYAFPAGTQVQAATYSITARNYGSIYYPTSWTLQGSNDDSSWTTLHTVSGAAAWSAGETRTYTITSPGAYRYYRLNITAGQSSTIAIDRFDLFDAPAYLVIQSAPVTTPGSASSYMVDMSVASGTNYTVQIDTGDGAGWRTITMSRTAVSATVDQLSGTISASGTSTKVRVTAAELTGVVYGLSLFWK